MKKELLLVARNKEKLKLISNQITGDITITSVDVTDAESVEKLVEFAKGWSESIDIVVNVSGYDVRKSLDEHSIESILIHVIGFPVKMLFEILEGNDWEGRFE